MLVAAPLRRLVHIYQLERKRPALPKASHNFAAHGVYGGLIEPLVRMVADDKVSMTLGIIIGYCSVRMYIYLSIH